MTPSPAPVSAEPASAPVSGPTHGCVRCGARIPIHESMCESCNPLGLKSPSASQAHGTVFLGIGIAVVVMAVVARMIIANMGPCTTSVAGVVTDPGGLKVSVTVTNQGTTAGATTCRIDDPTLRGIGPEAAFVESPVVQGGETVTFDVIVGGFGTKPITLIAVCGR
jgi:predicted nucleic acid-binding Zn ribbon protein